ncbi:hypothetical protein [Parasphingorhabdus pacifica]
MEDADTVVPLRPGFDIQVRGFNRGQVMDHVEQLENQLKLVTIDRNEAAQLNADLRKLCEDTRHDLAEAEERLRSIESSDTGLPAASQRVQNMLAIAEEEVQSLRDTAKRQAETIRGSAETEAGELLSEAERAAEEIRADCAQLLERVEARNDEVRREHAQALKDLRERDQRLRHSIRDAYKRAMDIAQQETDQMLAQTREQCAELRTDTERRRREAFAEIRSQQENVTTLRMAVVSAMEQVRESLETSSAGLHDQVEEAGDPLISTEAQHHQVPEQLREESIPQQRENVQTFTFPLDALDPNGAPRAAEDHDTVQRT